MSKWFHKLSAKLIQHSWKTPYGHLPGYMSRWWLVPYNHLDDHEHSTGIGPVRFTKRPFVWVLQKLNVAVRVHHILRSDTDEAFHDHPWPYLSVILRGGYFEVTPNYDESGIFIGNAHHWYGPGSIVFRRAKHLHRLAIPKGQTAWTLFITFKKAQRWGFVPNPNSKIYYREYLGDHLDGRPS